MVMVGLLELKTMLITIITCGLQGMQVGFVAKEAIELLSLNDRIEA
jgi:hypothetical protein